MPVISRKPEKLVELANAKISEILRYDGGEHTYTHSASERKQAALSGIRLFKSLILESRNLASSNSFENSLWLLHTASRLGHTITGHSGYEYVPKAEKASFAKMREEGELKRVWTRIADQIERQGSGKREAQSALQYLGGTLQTLTCWGSSSFESSRFNEMARSPEFVRVGPLAADYIIKLIDSQIDSKDSEKVRQSIQTLQSNRDILYAFGRAADENRLNARYTLLYDQVHKTIRENDEKVKDLRQVQRVIQDAYHNYAIREVKTADPKEVIKVAARG